MNLYTASIEELPDKTWRWIEADRVFDSAREAYETAYQETKEEAEKSYDFVLFIEWFTITEEGEIITRAFEEEEV